MTIGILLDAVLNDEKDIFVTPELCKRQRFRKSGCQNCVDVCPDNAITLSAGPSINDNCSNCGLCQNVCPTEVFQNTANLDQVLLHQVKSLFNKDQSVGENKTAFIHCSQAEKQDKKSMAIRCLGNVSENFILGAALSGIDEVELTKGNCSQCHLNNGEALLTSSMKTAHAIVKNVGVDEFSMSLSEEQKNNDVETPLSRREFFSKIAHRVTDSAPSNLSAQSDGGISHGQLEIKDGTRRSPKREMLRNLLKQNGRDNAVVNIKQQTLPWKKMKVDEKNCVACAICVNVCPTGALTKVFENNQIVRHLNDSLCSNCNLCQEACPENAISFVESYSVSDLIEDKTHEVARIDMTGCAICGEIMPVKHGEICTTCDKRQMSPMFMKAKG